MRGGEMSVAVNIVRIVISIYDLNLHRSTSARSKVHTCLTLETITHSILRQDKLIMYLIQINPSHFYSHPNITILSNNLMRRLTQQNTHHLHLIRSIQLSILLFPRPNLSNIYINFFLERFLFLTGCIIIHTLLLITEINGTFDSASACRLGFG